MILIGSPASPRGPRGRVKTALSRRFRVRTLFPGLESTFALGYVLVLFLGDARLINYSRGPRITVLDLQAWAGVCECRMVQNEFERLFG